MFELRSFDTRTARWSAPDPYMQHYSPYLAMGNNPVSSTDADGGWAEFSFNLGQFIQGAAALGSIVSISKPNPNQPGVWIQEGYGNAYGWRLKLNLKMDFSSIHTGSVMSGTTRENKNVRIMVLLAEGEAKGAGHMALLVRDPDSRKWYYYSKNGTPENGTTYGNKRYGDNTGDKDDQYNTVTEFLKSDDNDSHTDPSQRRYDQMIEVIGRPGTFPAIRQAVEKSLKKPYGVGEILDGEDCRELVERGLIAAKPLGQGLPIDPEQFPSLLYSPISPFFLVLKIPNIYFQEIKFELVHTNWTDYLKRTSKPRASKPQSSNWWNN